MTDILKADWYFIIPTSVIFFSALFVALWDFILIQEPARRGGLTTVVGVGLFLTGLATRLVAKRTLGNHYSYFLKIGQNPELICYGIYRYVRHPVYCAMLIYSAAIPLIFSSLYSFLIMLGLIPCTLYRIKIEEGILLEEFGDEYTTYMKTTRKLIPFIY